MGNSGTKVVPIQKWTSQQVYDAIAGMGPMNNLLKNLRTKM